MTITNEAQLATSLEILLRCGLDYLGIIDPYDRIFGRREQGARVWFVCVNAIRCAF